MTATKNNSDQTESGAYGVSEVGGKWYYHPTEHDWFAFNANNSFSTAYKTKQEALAAAQEWEDNQDAD